VFQVISMSFGLTPQWYQQCRQNAVLLWYRLLGEQQNEGWGLRRLMTIGEGEVQLLGMWK